MILLLARNRDSFYTIFEAALERTSYIARILSLLDLTPPANRTRRIEIFPMPK